MKMKSVTTLAVVGLMAASLLAPAYAQKEKSIFEQAATAAKQSAKDFKPAAEQTKTRFGNLEFPGGYPTEETTQKVYDELDLGAASLCFSTQSNDN